MDDSDRLSVLRRELAQRLGKQRYELWLGPHTSLEFAEGQLSIGCPTPFECQWLRGRLQPALQAACQQVWGQSVTILYHVLAKPAQPAEAADSSGQDSSGQDPSGHASSGHDSSGQDVSDQDAADGLANASGEFSAAFTTTSTATSPVGTPAAESPAAGHAPRRRPGQLSSFANFVVGKNNELAYRTAESVAKRPGQYGPLLLFGLPGVGKTHLCYAMLQHVRRGSDRAQALRVTAEQFTGEFLAALHRRTLPSFRQKYRSIDVLLIEDIQFLVGKRATLDELLHTIDTLHEQGRQVVMTCDRSPGDLQKVSLELVSRISGGLAIPVEPPDFATRQGIVQQLALRLKVALDDEVIRLIATQVAGSARQLAGAINRLVATSMAHDAPITAELARTTLVDFVQQSTPAVRLADIQRAVCEVFGVEASSLKSDRKTRSIAEPRMLAMWLARKYTRAALGEIGQYFGRRSHSTVVSAQKKIERLVSENAQISVADRPCQVEEAIRQVEAVLRTA